MKRQIPINSSLYDPSYGHEFPEGQYYVILFDSIPSVYTIKGFYSVDVLNYFVNDLGFEEVARIKTIRDRGTINQENRLYCNKNRQTIISVRGRSDKGEESISIELYYNIKYGLIEKQYDFDKIKVYKRTTKKSNIQIVKSEMGHMDTEEYELKFPECDLEMNYGKKFLKVHDIIVNRLNSNGDKGIVLLHGDPGTGKTTYIKYLTSLIKDKEILFIPPSMAETLSEPSIIPFLMEHRNSILLIEDAEKVVGSRDGGGSQIAVSNLLNLTDGILGDCLNIQVIATFNMNREKIDNALLRKGRLICEHKFEALSVEETNILLKHLKKDKTSNEGLTLADIYNIEVDTNRITTERRPAGFQYRGNSQ